MVVETAADLACFFDDEEFAEAAGYQPPGGGAFQDCLVIVDRGQGRDPVDAGERDASISERHIWAQKSELPELGRGGTFVIYDPEQLPVKVVTETYTVTGLPKLDHIGHLWSVQLLIAS